MFEILINPFTLLKLTALAITTVGLNSCSNQSENTMTNEHYIIPENCDFSTVTNNDTSPNDCSPALTDKYRSPFKGLVINAPDKVTIPHSYDPDNELRSPSGVLFSGGFEVPVTGLYVLPYNYNGRKQGIAQSIVIVAINKKTAAQFSGKLLKFGISSPLPPPPPGRTEETMKQLSSRGHFSIDLLHNLKIPAANADYYVYAVLDEYKSNTVEISVTREQK